MVTMLSRSSGPWVTTFSILFLFLQGINGKSILEHRSDDGGELSPADKLKNALMEMAYPKEAIPGNYTLTNESALYQGMNTSSTSELQPFTGAVGKTWNDRMRNILISVTSLIPPVYGIPIGKIVSLTLKILWPVHEPSTWDLVKDQVAGLIDEKILEYELQERENEIRALHKTMQMYAEAQIKEKGSLMSAMIQACNELYYKLTNSKNSLQLIPLVVTHSTAHLMILKERLVHGEEMYGEDNTAVWRKNLEDQINSYKGYAMSSFFKWSSWRDSEITIEYGVHNVPDMDFPFFRKEPYGIVLDKFTGQKIEFIYGYGDRPNDKNFFKPQVEATKQRLFGEKQAELLQILVTAFYYDNFIPGNEDNPSKFHEYISAAYSGPITPATVGGFYKYPIYYPDNDNTGNGDVTKVSIRAGYIIDAIQITYTTHTGEFIGDSQGGKLHELPLNGRRVKSMEVCVTNCNVAQITIVFSDGLSSGPIGNEIGAKIQCTKTGGIDTFGLFNIEAQRGGCLNGVVQIALGYKAFPVRPSQLDNRAKYFLDLSLERYQYVSVLEEEEKKKC